MPQKVLIVEDDHSMRELLMDHFGRKYMVMSAESGEVTTNEELSNFV